MTSLLREEAIKVQFVWRCLLNLSSVMLWKLDDFRRSIYMLLP